MSLLRFLNPLSLHAWGFPTRDFSFHWALTIISVILILSWLLLVFSFTILLRHSAFRLCFFSVSYMSLQNILLSSASGKQFPVLDLPFLVRLERPVWLQALLIYSPFMFLYLNSLCLFFLGYSYSASASHYLLFVSFTMALSLFSTCYFFRPSSFAT